MKRRAFIGLVGRAAAAWPLAIRAQQSKLPVIGFLSASTLEGQSQSIAAFHRGLGEAGYVDGRNVAIEYRVAEDHVDRLPALAADLARRQVAVIATASNLPAALAAKTATATIPVVFLMGADPVENGLVPSLARPEGNLTGVTLIAADLYEKRLGLLHELVPAAELIASLANPSNPAFAKFAPNVPVAARALGVKVFELYAATPIELERAFTTLIQRQARALLVGPDTFFLAQRDLLVALAAQHSVPTSYFRRDFAEIGGLMSYSANYVDAFRQAGIYVGRILKGEKPADMPIQQPTKFELVINLKTAKALGLDVSERLLAIADEVIE